MPRRKRRHYQKAPCPRCGRLISRHGVGGRAHDAVCTFVTHNREATERSLAEQHKLPNDIAREVFRDVFGSDRQFQAFDKWRKGDD